ncbi:MAG: hypothetical protein OEZ11_16205 [Gammaproteobacteria bacterium]|nr:hypothetical protein [Gammaproteobacteria bacterium]
MEPITVDVVPVLAKEELDVQIVVADSSAATAQYGLIGALVGAVIDSAVNKRNAVVAERRAEVIRELTGEYDIVEAAHKATLRIGDHERFAVLAVSEPTTSVGWDDLANDAFESGTADVVVVLDFDFALTPTADQVRVNADQRVYFRSTAKKKDKNRKPASFRTFTYFSPVQTVVNRPFEDGEKEQLLDALQDDYEERMTAHPDEKDDLEKAMKAEIEDLQKADTIPEVLALRETWTTEQLSRYLDQSIDHIAFMLRHDWESASVPEESVRTEDKFVVVNANGFAMQDKGKDIARLDENEIYRSQWGHMYSVPAPE